MANKERDEKGHFLPGSPLTGRKKGQRNKRTRDAKEMILLLQAKAFNELQTRFDELKPSDLVKLFCHLSEFTAPKLARSEMDVELNGLSDDQLLALEDRLFRRVAHSTIEEAQLLSDEETGTHGPAKGH